MLIITFLFSIFIAPIRPRSGKVINWTETTIYFEWKPPTRLNGILRYYQLRWFDVEYRVTERSRVAPTFLHFNITGLKPWTTYTIGVAAFTVALSEYYTISIRTGQGCKSV